MNESMDTHHYLAMGDMGVLSFLVAGCVSAAALLLSCASVQGQSLADKNRDLVLTMNREVWKLWGQSKGTE
jgi:hypothetical protein